MPRNYFCCTSNLILSRLKDSNEHQLAVGLFDKQKNFHFDLQVYTDRKPAFYSFANETKEMTEAEVIEKFAPEQNSSQAHVDGRDLRRRR